MAFSLVSLTDNCAAIVLSIVILLSGLRVASSAPTNEQDWWINPCNKQPLVRHSRSAAENQLIRFLLEVKTRFFKDIKELYKTTDNVRFKGNCPRIKNMLMAVKNASSHYSATQAFYGTLLQFAVFIEKLKNTPVKTKGEFDNSRRKHIFDEAKEHLRLLICEYNDTLSNYKGGKHHDKGVVLHRNKKVPKFNMRCLPKMMDHTQAHFMDIDFFKKLQKFLRQGNRYVKVKKNPSKGGNKKGNKVPKRTKKLKQ